MRTLILLIMLVITGQNLGQNSAPQAGLKAREATTEVSLEGRLMEQARLIYGADVVRKVTLANRGPLPTTAGYSPVRGKGAEGSPFDDSNVMETTKPMSYKGDVASGVILSEEKDALYLDVTPCRADKSVFTFRPPFEKKRIGAILCAGRSIDRYLVAQR